MGLLSDVGALRFPIVGTGATDLSALDPARDIMLALFASAITAELDDVWPAAVRDTPLDARRTHDRHPVRVQVPFAPEPHTLKQDHTKFPALYCYRQETPITIVQFTLWQRRYKSRWGVDYFLGPLDIGSQGRLQDILVAVGKVIGEVIEAGGHDSYAGGANVLGTVGIGCCGFSTVMLADFRPGVARFATGEGDRPAYLACTATIETTEEARPRNDGAAAPLSGLNLTVGTGTEEGVIPNLVEATSDEAP